MTRATPDWERIEVNYAAGVMTLREIATEDGHVTEGAIRKRAKRDGWTRDLRGAINRRVEALVRKAEVRKTEVRTEDLRTKPGLQIDADTERETIEANALAITNVKMGHRTSATSGFALGTRLLAELEGQSLDPALMRQLGELLAAPDDRGMDKLNELYQKAISLPGRVSTYKAAIEGLKIAINLQRQAWGLDDEGAGTQGGFEELVRDIVERST